MTSINASKPPATPPRPSNVKSVDDNNEDFDFNANNKSNNKSINQSRISGGNLPHEDFDFDRSYN